MVDILIPESGVGKEFGMPAILIVDETISDPVFFEEYKRAVVPTIARLGGRFLVRGAALEILESSGGWVPDRVVIVEFPDMATLRAWYDSADYAPMREISLRSASSTLVAMETSPVDPKL